MFLTVGEGAAARHECHQTAAEAPDVTLDAREMGFDVRYVMYNM